jgi:hypothetical protein
MAQQPSRNCPPRQMRSSPSSRCHERNHRPLPKHGWLTMNPIVIAKISAKDLKIEFQTSGPDLDLATTHSIHNAWMETTIIDNHGVVWIRPKRLSEIIRTSKANAKYIVDKITKEHKQQNATGTYLRYSEVNKLLSKIIETPGANSREKYATYSESIGIAIRDSPQAKLLRLQTFEEWQKAKKRLKQQRLKTLKLSHDELTGKPLLISSQFSHIRSCSVYPHLLGFVWNGLIINRDTHQTITHQSLNDEEELYDLCQKQRWSIDWYDKYQADLN